MTTHMARMTRTFREALMWHMERHETKIADLASGSGVSPDVIKKLRTRDTSSTKAEAADKIAAYYGKSTADFMKCEDSVDRTARLMALLGQLTDEETDLIAMQVQGILANRARG